MPCVKRFIRKRTCGGWGCEGGVSPNPWNRLGTPPYAPTRRPPGERIASLSEREAPTFFLGHSPPKFGVISSYHNRALAWGKLQGLRLPLSGGGCLSDLPFAENFKLFWPFRRESEAWRAASSKGRHPSTFRGFWYEKSSLWVALGAYRSWPPGRAESQGPVTRYMTGPAIRHWDSPPTSSVSSLGAGLDTIVCACESFKSRHKRERRE